MDRERANFDKTVAEIKDQLPINPVIIQLPIGAEENFRGFVDLLAGTAYFYAEDGSGKMTAADIPADMADDVAIYRESLMESVAETDDELIEKFLEEGELTHEE